MAGREGRNTRSGRIFFQLFQEGDWRMPGKNLSFKTIYYIFFINKLKIFINCD